MSFWKFLIIGFICSAEIGLGFTNIGALSLQDYQTTTENGKTVVECQHGPEECYGNKLHACAIDILKNNTQSVFYNACLLSGQSTDEDATKCGASMGVDAKSIIECAQGEKSEQLLEYYGEETHKDVPHKKGVPWPLVNGNHVEPLPNFMYFYMANKYVPTPSSI